jgi:hypothetical protein
MHVAMLRAGHINPDGGEGAEPPITDLLPMLEAVSTAPVVVAADPGMPAALINPDLLRTLMTIETFASGNAQVARRNSLAALAEFEQARTRRLPIAHAPTMTAAGLKELVIDLVEGLAA